MQLARPLIMFDSTLIWEGNGGTPDVSLRGESGFGYPKRENRIDQIGDPYINLQRGTVSKERVYQLDFDIVACSPTALDTAIVAWENLHDPGVERVLKRVTANGGVFYLDCRPEDPDWSDHKLSSVHVTQKYVAANPWWYGPQVSASSAFNNAVPVNIAVNNTGSIPAWLRIVITNAVTDPKVTVSGGYFVELDYANGAAEVITITCKPPASIVHSVAGDLFGYHTSDSWFNRVAIPTGASNVTIVAAAGVATCAVYWTPLYGVRS